MTRFGDDRAPTRHTTSGPARHVPARDLTDDEYSEAVDRDREQADRLVHADGIRWCPDCESEVLTTRRGLCVWCDNPTKERAA